MPAIAPPRIENAVSLQLGSTSATVSVSPIPRLRNRFAAWQTRPWNSRQFSVSALSFSPERS